MLQLITAPTAEPVTLAEARAHLKEPEVSDDPMIVAMITAARERAEAETRRQLMSATWDLHLDAFPVEDVIVLPRPPLQSVTHVKYYDADGVQQTLSSALYHVDAVSEPARIVLVDGEDWPDTEERPNAVTVRFVAGYQDAYDVPAATAATVPAAIRQWLLLQVGAMYENRQAADGGAMAATTVLPFVDALLDPYRLFSV